MNEPAIHKIVTTALLVYVLTAAIPFVPGAEIGFVLLIFFGGRAAPVVYIGMVGALLLSYSVARLVPTQVLSRILAGLGLARAGALVAELAACDADARWHLIEERVRTPLVRRVLHNRYLLLAVLLNLPGNSLIGGGGGLAFAAGLSRTIAFWPFVAVVLIAVLPVPLIFLLMWPGP